MRLINVATLRTEEFFDADVPAYACLSHRWSKQEVTFQEWQSLTSESRKKSGYAKILAACKIVHEKAICNYVDGKLINWLWVDTCCIDKTNSSELSEAINSMWKWYRDCAICIVYLHDFDRDQVAYCDANNSSLPLDPAARLGASEWFKRAWTLQELIAPNKVVFFNSRWQNLGEKDVLLNELEEAAQIDRAALSNFQHDRWSVAQKMSWAAPRKATRSEDLAYSLIGLFDVNMPMLYGEGPKAFLRLQEEILRRTADTTIFAWEVHSTDGSFSGDLFADSPQRFRGCRRMELPLERLLRPSCFMLNNMGLELELTLVPWRMDLFWAMIAHHEVDNDDICMLVKRVGDMNTMKRSVWQDSITWSSKRIGLVIGGNDTWLKLHKVLLLLGSESFNWYILNAGTISYNGILLQTSLLMLPSEAWREIVWPGPNAVEDATRNGSALLLGDGPSSYGTIAVGLIKTNDVQAVEVVMLAFDNEYNPMCLIFSEDIRHYEPLKFRAQTKCSRLFDSRWITSRWDDHQMTHLRTTHMWTELGHGAYVFKSIDGQDFSTGKQNEVCVTFSKEFDFLHIEEDYIWVVTLSRNERENVYTKSTTAKTIIEDYRRSTFGPDFGIDHLQQK